MSEAPHPRTPSKRSPARKGHAPPRPIDRDRAAARLFRAWHAAEPGRWPAIPRTLDEFWRQQGARNQAALSLLQSWQEVDEAEAQAQHEALTSLMRALDDDRPSDRKLFPCDAPSS